ncbi:hypothetical protein JCM1840_000881 [Sporobolomyces johnsonii]
MSPAEPPPPYFSDSPTLRNPSPLLRLPLHLLFNILSHLSLPALVFSAKPTCRTLHLAACVVGRNRQDVQTGWTAGLRRAASLAKKTRVSTGIGPSALIGGDQPQPSYASPARAGEPPPPPSGGGGERLRRTREEAVLDTYIAGLARIALQGEASSLLVGGGRRDEEEEEEGSEAPVSDPTLERDVFAFLQPKARCEDLVIDRGCKDGFLVVVGVDGGTTGPRASSGGGGTGGLGAVVRADDVRVELKPRSARLLLPLLSTTGTVVWKGVSEVQRGEAEGLEETAAALSAELRWMRLRRGEDRDGRTWYEVVS